MFLLAQLRESLVNYDGGSNPILLVSFILLVLFSIVGVITWFVLQRLKEIKFQNLCRQHNITGTQFGFLLDYIQRLHIRDPLTVIASAERYDQFIGRVAHLLEDAPLSEKELAETVQIAGEIRGKLNLKRRINKNNLPSHTIPVGYPLTIYYHDPQATIFHSFETTVVDNNDLFLAVTPPDREIHREMYKVAKPTLEVSFTRKDDADYTFESRLIRTIGHPNALWCLRHHTHLMRSETYNSLCFPASVLISATNGDAAVDELAVTIRSLSPDGCTFSLNSVTKEQLSSPSTALISFQMNQEDFSCPGEVTDIGKTLAETSYRVKFSNLNPERRVSLLNFSRQLAREQQGDRDNKLSTTSAGKQ